VLAASVLREDMVQGELAAALATVLAALAIAGKDFSTGEAGTGVGAADEVGEADDRRGGEGPVFDARYWLVPLFEDFSLTSVDEDKRPSDRAHIEWFVVLVQDQRTSLDRHEIPRSL